MAVQEQRSKSESGFVTTDVTDTLHPTQQDGSITWSRHSLERYYSRTPSNACCHNRAWRDGIDAQFATPYFRDTTTNRFPEIVRIYDHGTCTSVMVVHGGQVRTVLLVELIKDSAIKTYLHSLTDLHQKKKLVNNTELWGESASRVEEVNSRRR